MSSQVRQVKDATDIVQVIGERVNLQRSGKNFRGLCPFHSEKSPSFFVSPDFQSYRCFGCGERGDVFTFLEKYDGLTFAEALKLLADQAGIVLEKTQFTQDDHFRERLLDALALAGQYYHYLLTEHKVGQIAREYIENRGITTETVKHFKIGYSTSSWDGLIQFLVKKKKFTLPELLSAGLIIQRQNTPQQSKNSRDYYDRFRDRVMFPLTDHRGRVVGFSGRVLDPDAKTAKYINSPETQLYHKSELLFGLSENYQAIRKANAVIIVEGEFDVLSSVQAKVDNVVAIKGSALTADHLRRLDRVVDTVILSLDTDSAGIEATRRAIQVASDFPNVRLRVLPSFRLNGKDPDEVARANPKQWREHVKHTDSAFQFLLDAALQKHSLTTGEGKQAIVQEVGPMFQLIPHAVERSHYVNKLATALGVSESILQQDLTKLTTRKNTSKTRPEESIVQKTLTSREKIERAVLQLLLHFPEKEMIKRSRELEVSLFATSSLQQVLKSLQSKAQEDFSLRAWQTSLSPEVADFVAEIALSPDESETQPKVFHKTVERLKHQVIQSQISELSEKLEQPEIQADADQQQQILQEIVRLRTQLVRYTPDEE